MSNKDIKFVFFGTPDVAKNTLEILKSYGCVPSLIVTATDKPQGRKMIITPPPVKVWAIENDIPYIQPDKLSIEMFDKGAFDFFLVVAYGKILSEDIINFPRLGSVNIHYSLLPKYRGASPVESAILNGEIVTGVTIQQMEFKMDTGPILAVEKTEILVDEKTPELRERLIKIGAELFIKILPEFLEGKVKPIVQNESQATYCKKIKKEEGLVDLDKDLPKIIYNKFRAYASWPRIFFFKENKRIIITDMILENNKIKILKVLPEGRKEISWIDFQKQN